MRFAIPSHRAPGGMFPPGYFYLDTGDTMTRDELERGLRSIRGSRIVSFVARTTPDMRKTGNPYYGLVNKVSWVNGTIGFNYTSSVQRATGDTEFVAGPRKWGQRLLGTPLVEHNGKLYLEVLVRSATCHYETLDGTRIDRAALAPFLRSRDDSSPVTLRDYALESIVSLTYHGERLTVQS